MEVLMDGRWDTRQAEFIRYLIKKHKFSVYSVHSPFWPVSGWKASQVDRIKRALKIAETVGARVLIHHLPLNTFAGILRFGRDIEKSYRRWLLKEYASFQSSNKITLCIENMPMKRLLGLKFNPCKWNTVKGMLRFSSIALDTTHLGTWGLDPAEVYEEWREKVNHIHISNYDGKEHRRPEKGNVDLKKFLKTVAKYQYNRAITMELHPDSLKEGRPDEEIINLMKKSLGFCKEWSQVVV